MKFIKTTLDDRWDRFVESSPQGSIFSTSAFLGAVGYNVDAYYVKKGTQTIAAFVCVVDNDNIIQAPHVVHSGIMFWGWGDKNIAQINSAQFEVTEFIVAEITKLYNDICFNLHPAIIDIRPFLWHNYHDEGRRFVVDIRYTSYLIPCYAESSNSRQQAIREASSIIAQVKKGDIDCLATLYQSKFGNSPLNIMKALGDKLHIYQYENDMLAVGIHSNIAYMLWQVGKEYATALLIHAMQQIQRKDYSILKFDLEGINSPKRGAFKLSFGGSITPYYQVKLTPQ